MPWHCLLARSAALWTLAITNISALAAVTSVILPDTSNLAPNSVNTIHLYVTGTDQIEGEDLNLQINNALSGPIFAANGVDILTGTIFGTNNTGQLNIYSQPRIVAVSTTTASSTVQANGLLVTLQIDTTGVSGTFQLNLYNTLNGDSNFVLANGTTISPAYPGNMFSIGNTSRIWNINGGGTWSQNANWNLFAPYTTGDAAQFLAALTSGSATITLDGDPSPRAPAAVSISMMAPPPPSSASWPAPTPSAPRSSLRPIPTSPPVPAVC
jgi:hypothetical protein